ncbi:MAG: hypothetical protein OEX80_05025 [Candidatus Aminicenantes bacterium]|nr:hypothetical protein [Candidatus Aminicenantes bacterium]
MRRVLTSGIFIVFCFFTLVILAQVPQLLNYQGRLTDDKGIPITTATIVRFSLYQGGDAATPLSGTLCYQEDASVTPDDNGVFNHLIGSGTVISGTLDSTVFQTAEPVYLEITIEPAGANETLLPRKQIVTVGYSFKAEVADDADTVDGQHASAFSAVTHNHDPDYVNEGQADSVTSSMIVDGTIVDADINVSANIAASKINSTGLDADLLDGKDSEDFVHTAGDVMTGTLTVNTSSSSLALTGVTSNTSGMGVYGWASDTTGNTCGVYGTTPSTSGRGVRGYASATTGYIWGVLGESNSSTNGGGVLGIAPNFGVCGNATDTTYANYGVYGRSDSTSGHGVTGVAYANDGNNYGVYGITYSSSGYGVYGTAPKYGIYGFVTDYTDTNYGLYGKSYSTNGYGVYGIAIALSGTTYGVYGQSDSPDGRGVYGNATATSGVNYGVYGISSSDSGYGVFGTAPTYGVFGEASAASGTAYGVFGKSNSDSGKAVYGWANSTSGTTYGVYGKSDSNTGIGVSGEATATSGTTYGVYGSSQSPNGAGVYGVGHYTPGYGVYGYADASSGTTYGVYGKTTSTSGWAVVGESYASSGVNYGVVGVNNSPTGYGVYGNAQANSGTNYGIYGTTNSASGYAGFFSGHVRVTKNLYVMKDLIVDGNKTCVQPIDNGKKVLLYAMESPEIWFEDFGTAKLNNGQAVVQLESVFTQAANIEMGYLIFLTPIGDCNGLYIARQDKDAFEVRELGGGTSSISFYYRIVAKRRGYEEVRFEEFTEPEQPPEEPNLPIERKEGNLK